MNDKFLLALAQFNNFYFILLLCSLGALLSFDVARQMKSQYKLEPVKMFVSGVSAPHVSLLIRCTLEEIVVSPSTMVLVYTGNKIKA